MRNLILLFLPVAALAQPWSGIISAGRAIDWSQVGIPGGIPARATICTTINASTYGNGASDAATGIQNALDACPSGQSVLLGPGTFKASNILVPSNVTLRGSGAQSTVLNAFDGGTGVLAMGLTDTSTPTVANSTNINSGATAGSTSIVVASATGISVGTYLLITELNNDAYVTIETQDSNPCIWCDNSMWAGTRVRGQIVEVTSVAGTTIGISPGLYSAYGSAAGTGPAIATRFTAAAKYAGIENLQINGQDAGYTSMIFMNQCAYCWIKGVQVNYADNDQVDVYFSYRVEIRDSYFNNAQLHTSGSSDSCLFIVGKTSASLIENNIFERLHTSIMLNWGAAGNVIAYNYTTSHFSAGATNVLTLDVSMHGAHPQFNLLEGNAFSKIVPDSFWGSSSDNTVFRNHLIATTLIAEPYSGRSTINWGAAHYANQQNRGLDIAYPHLRYNVIGNVAGGTDAEAATSSEYTGGPTACPACLVLGDATRNYDNWFYPMTFGFGTPADTGGAGVPPEWEGLAYTTAQVEGNYDTATNATQWSGSTISLPASFYLSSKPAWFGSIPWPAVGPDVTGGVDAGAHVYRNPAHACYLNTSRNAEGIKQFDPSVCYAASSGSSSSSRHSGRVGGNFRF